MTENGYEYVDLGLPSKTMWATCNVGATELEDEGLLFQFGCVDGYRYDDTNHKFRTDAQNLEDGSTSEYIPITSSGKAYKVNDILDLKDDAAHVNMGGKWRMPIKDELEELYNNTTHDVVTINGVLGMRFTSNINGYQLFIPFAGYWYNSIFADAEYNGYLLSSQVHASSINSAYRLNCYSSDYANVSNSFRSFAFSVRGVFKK